MDSDVSAPIATYHAHLDQSPEQAQRERERTLVTGYRALPLVYHTHSHDAGHAYRDDSQPGEPWHEIEDDHVR